MFYRLNDEKNAVLFHDSEKVVTQLHSNTLTKTIYPVNSNCSSVYEHPDGIVVTEHDARIRLGLESK